MSVEQNIRRFKDFLEFYNLMSETCFSHCINTFKRNSIEEDEAECIERCATKLARFNNRAILIYADIQQNLVDKRIAEAEKEAAAKIEAENNKEVSQEIPSSALTEQQNESTSTT